MFRVDGRFPAQASVVGEAVSAAGVKAKAKGGDGISLRRQTKKCSVGSGGGDGGKDSGRVASSNRRMSLPQVMPGSPAPVSLVRTKSLLSGCLACPRLFRVLNGGEEHLE